MKDRIVAEHTGKTVEWLTGALLVVGSAGVVCGTVGLVTSNKPLDTLLAVLFLIYSGLMLSVGLLALHELPRIVRRRIAIGLAEETVTFEHLRFTISAFSKPVIDEYTWPLSEIEKAHLDRSRRPSLRMHTPRGTLWVAHMSIVKEVADVLERTGGGENGDQPE